MAVVMEELQLIFLILEKYKMNIVYWNCIVVMIFGNKFLVM